MSQELRVKKKQGVIPANKVRRESDSGQAGMTNEKIFI